MTNEQQQLPRTEQLALRSSERSKQGNIKSKLTRQKIAPHKSLRWG